jgi:hypothetical protein
MPSLSPRRNFRAHVPVLPECTAFASNLRARLPVSYVTRLPSRSLSLRPGCLLTVPETALSTGSKQPIARPPAVQATRLSAFVMVGLFSNWMHLPCLDAQNGHNKADEKQFNLLAISNNLKSYPILLPFVYFIFSTISRSPSILILTRSPILNGNVLSLRTSAGT